MLTVDSEELLRIRYDGFSERKIRFIKETLVRFQHFEPSQRAGNWDWIRLDGHMFGQPDYEYWIYRVSNGIKVQVEKKFGYERDLFGFVMCRITGGGFDCTVFHTAQLSTGRNDLDDNL